jgi:hypothetical protein
MKTLLQTTNSLIHHRRRSRSKRAFDERPIRTTTPLMPRVSTQGVKRASPPARGPVGNRRSSYWPKAGVAGAQLHPEPGRRAMREEREGSPLTILLLLATGAARERYVGLGCPTASGRLGSWVRSLESTLRLSQINSRFPHKWRPLTFRSGFEPRVETTRHLTVSCRPTVDEGH